MSVGGPHGRIAGGFKDNFMVREGATTSATPTSMLQHPVAATPVLRCVIPCPSARPIASVGGSIRQSSRQVRVFAGEKARALPEGALTEEHLAQAIVRLIPCPCPGLAPLPLSLPS